MDYKNPCDLERVAIHEAGHAVVASLSPMLPPVTSVGLTEGGGGFIATASTAAAFQSTTRDYATRGDLFAQAIRVCAAGAIAELLAFGETVSDPQQEGTDMPKIVKLTQELAFLRVDHLLASDARHDPKPEQVFAWARARALGPMDAAEWILRARWGAVQLVAQRLLEVGTMPAPLLEVLLETAPNTTKPCATFDEDRRLMARAGASDRALGATILRALRKAA